MYFLSRQQRIAMPTCKAQPQKVGSRADHRPVAQNLHFSSSFSSVPLCLRMIRKLPQSEGRPAGLLAKSAAERKVQKCKAGGAMAHYCTALHCCAESEALKSGRILLQNQLKLYFCHFFLTRRPLTSKTGISSNANHDFISFVRSSMRYSCLTIQPKAGRELFQIRSCQYMLYNISRPNCARNVREMILFNVLCTVYCGTEMQKVADPADISVLFFFSRC